MVSFAGKRWSKPDHLAELLEAEDAPELIKFWRSPVFGEKFYKVPTFLLPRVTEMAPEVATEFPDPHTGLRVYDERVSCLIVLAGVAPRTDPASFRLDEPPRTPSGTLAGPWARPSIRDARSRT